MVRRSAGARQARADAARHTRHRAAGCARRHHPTAHSATKAAAAGSATKAAAATEATSATSSTAANTASSTAATLAHFAPQGLHLCQHRVELLFHLRQPIFRITRPLATKNL